MGTQQKRVPQLSVLGGRERLQARHSFIRPGRPQTNGRVEAVQQTILEECYRPAFARYLVPKFTGLRLDLARYERHYNLERSTPAG